MVTSLPPLLGVVLVHGHLDYAQVLFFFSDIKNTVKNILVSNKNFVGHM